MSLVIIIGGIAGGLIVFGMVVTVLLLRARRKQYKHVRIELDPMVEHVVRDSSSESEESIRSYPSLSDAYAAQSATNVAYPPSLPSTSTSALYPVPLHYVASPNFDNHTALTNKSSTSSLSYSHSDKGAGAQPPHILVLSPPTPPVASSSGTAPIHSKHEPIRSAADIQADATNIHLTDDVSGLRDADVLAPDLVREIARTRRERAASSRGDVHSGTAPPSYDVLYSSV
jgi:hypothetical protein